MLRKILKTLRGVFFLLLYLFVLVLSAITTLIMAIVVAIIPLRAWRRWTTPLLLKFPVWWIDLNKVIMKLSTRGRWDIQGTGNLNSKHWYLLISNHTSWLDIIVLGYVFNHKAPVMKFFMKRELLWTLPVAGVVCYIMGYPFMRRVSREDIRKNPELKNADTEMIHKACDKLREFPTTIMNFIEGTRFTEEKKLKQTSPYRYLLKPKAGGIAMVLHEMSEQISGIINVTIHYSSPTVSLWDFACGNFAKINIRYEVLPITPDLIGDYSGDREFRKHFQQWLNVLWERKDAQLQELHRL